MYSSSYMAGHPHTGRYFVLLHGFMLSMLGIVTADNLLLLFVCWEGTTVFSYLLIGFDHESIQARDNARQALLVTGAGGLALLIGILSLKLAGESYTISQWMTGASAIQEHALYPFILVMVLLGALTKSAQFPFHFWLPNAMSAPTPISAFLHAATMVKAGIYLLMRFHPLLGGAPAWMCTLVIVGGVTAVWRALQAFGPLDLKRVLAFTTTMALGLMTMFLGGKSAAVLTAATTFLLVHALYKAALFLAAGIIDHETGTRQLDRLGGLARGMPLTALGVAAGLYDQGLSFFLKSAKVITNRLQNGALHTYLTIILLVMVTSALWPWVQHASFAPQTPAIPLHMAALGLTVLTAVSTLVDFRGLDTFGEITVVFLAAWAGVALIRKTREPS